MSEIEVFGSSEILIQFQYCVTKFNLVDIPIFGLCSTEAIHVAAQNVESAIWFSFISVYALFAFDTSQAAVSSIDLGSDWLKVAVVNLKPGQSPISIAINEMSKSKSPALVAFHSGTRLLREEAAGIVARYPDKV
ncbi:hypothetical protein SLA2020_376110 [Shorea laevis]